MDLANAEAAFERALAQVKGAAGRPGSEAELEAASESLAVAKASLHIFRKEAKKKKLQGGSPQCWNGYPPPLEIPRDPADPRFAVSFEPGSEEARLFFTEWGFVVFRDVLTAEACERTVAEIWQQLELRTPGLSRSQVSTHGLVTAKRYGLPDEVCVFTPQVVLNRQEPALYSSLAAVMPTHDKTRVSETASWPYQRPSEAPAAKVGGGALLKCQNHDRLAQAASEISITGRGPVSSSSSSSSSSILVSADRWCLFPPTAGDPSRRTSNPGLHLDICPWTYPTGGERRGRDPDANPDKLRYGADTDFRAEMNLALEEDGPHHQGVLNLVDNEALDGGTTVVPKFPAHFDAWRRSLGSWREHRVGQRRRGCAFVFSDPVDPIHALARRVPLRKGALLVWDQRCAHGAAPNDSERFRVAQFVRGFDARRMHPERLAARKVALRTKLAGAGLLGELTPLASIVFGVSREDTEEANEEAVRSF